MKKHRRSSAFTWVEGCLAALVITASSPAAHAEVKATGAWVRATVPTQKSTGAFMTLTSTEDARVVAARSPAARIVELHASSSKDGVASMQAVKAIELPAGKAVELKPGGHHVMLMALGKPVTAGEKVPIILTIEDKRGKRASVEVSAEVRPIASR